MTREEHSNKILALAAKNDRLLLRLPTGFGKTKVTLDILKDWQERKVLVKAPKISVLIVIPKVVLKDNWKAEIDKWYPDWNKWLDYTFVTYVSFPKIQLAYDVIVFDECHHFTERCAVAVEESRFIRHHIIAMSGTVPKEPRERLYECFEGIWSYSVSAREAMQDEILPDPTVLLIPLSLDNRTVCHLYVKNSKERKEAVVSYAERFKYIKQKGLKVTIRCTEQQYYSLLQQDVDFWDSFFKRTQQFWARNNYLRACGERLKWLSSIKTPLVEGIQTMLGNKRYITFCSSIEQAQKLGEFCIHSKDAGSYRYLDMFNDGEISNIAAVNVLNEGLNVTSCQVGLFAGLNSSEVITKQRLGRILRHKHPVIILPYFVCTRDEEIVNKMMKDYNPELVHKVSNLEDIKKYLL